MESEASPPFHIELDSQPEPPPNRRSTPGDDAPPALATRLRALPEVSEILGLANRFAADPEKAIALYNEDPFTLHGKLIGGDDLVGIMRWTARNPLLSYRFSYEAVASLPMRMFRKRMPSRGSSHLDPELRGGRMEPPRTDRWHPGGERCVPVDSNFLSDKTSFERSPSCANPRPVSRSRANLHRKMERPRSVSSSASPGLPTSSLRPPTASRDPRIRSTVGSEQEAGSPSPSALHAGTISARARPIVPRFRRVGKVVSFCPSGRAILEAPGVSAWRPHRAIRASRAPVSR